MTREQWAVLAEEIMPDMERLVAFGNATGNFDSLYRLAEYLNETRMARGLEPVDLSTLPLLADYRATAARTATVH